MPVKIESLVTEQNWNKDTSTESEHFSYICTKNMSATYYHTRSHFAHKKKRAASLL